jgi:hypothetical protein
MPCCAAKMPATRQKRIFAPRATMYNYTDCGAAAESAVQAGGAKESR